ncbi:MAG: SDR family NAD(P)-dependent oxidoreductase, partial [Myxococcota bacterium]|nr:SDR family NAD(P)-dependent oxidoreductase [Myxococcota bacterium]
MKEFRNRVAVVTGGASGIGKALAKAFLGEGMKVVIADVEEPALKAATEELGGEVTGIVCDVSDPASVKSLADQVFDTHGACHILCNNAGVSVANLDAWQTEPSDWQWVHGVNVHGVMHGIQAFVPRMIESGEEGYVLNT